MDEGKNVEANDKHEEVTTKHKPINNEVEQQRKEVEEFKPSDADMERIKRQEDRWNTPSGGVGATWKQEMEEMKKQK